METMSDSEYRRRLIARVEALRTEAGMPMLRFWQQMGPIAARRWNRFMTVTDEDAWYHFSLKAICRIAEMFEVRDTELLAFKPLKRSIFTVPTPS